MSQKFTETLIEMDELELMELRIASGEVPNKREITRLLPKYAGRKLPAIIVKFLVQDAAGQVQRQRGRKQRSEWDEIGFEILRHQRDRYAAWLRKRPKRLKGWSAIRGASWWQGPVSERALRMAQEYMRRTTGDFRMIDLRQLRNRLSEPPRG